jgi:phospholipase C
MGGETHIFINNQASTILRNDGLVEIAGTIEKYKQYLDMGNLWADKGWKYLAHYYSPDTGKGFIPFITAASEGNSHFNASIYYWKSGKKQKSMFYLGAAAHIIQDMCVPHHAKGIAFNGHRKFELWVLQNKDKFKAKREGLYKYLHSINDIINYNADSAQKYYDDVCYFNIAGYTKACLNLLTLAQRTTACLYNHFYSIITQ